MNKKLEKIKLKDICINVSKSEKNPLEKGMERYIGLEHLEPENLKIKNWGLIVDGTSFTKKFERGQVLFGKRRSYQKKAAVAEWNGICSGDILVFQAKKDKIIPELLPYIIQNEVFFDYAVGTSSGSLSPRTSWKHLAEYELYLPNKEIQRDILKKLTIIEDSVSKKKIFREKTVKYNKKLLNKLCTEGIENTNFKKTEIGIIPSNWKLSKLGKIGISKTSSVHKKIIKDDVKISLLNYMDVYNNTFINTSFPLMENTAKISQLESNNLIKGDILFTPSSETPDDIGHSAVISEDLKDSVYSYHLVRYRMNEDMNLLFKAYCFNSDIIKKQFFKRATGVTRFTLSLEDFNNILLPYPDTLKEQEKIGEILFKFDSELKSIQHEIILEQKLKKMLLKNFFNPSFYQG